MRIMEVSQNISETQVTNYEEIYFDIQPQIDLKESDNVKENSDIEKEAFCDNPNPVKKTKKVSKIPQSGVQSNGVQF